MDEAGGGLVEEVQDMYHGFVSTQKAENALAMKFPLSAYIVSSLARGDWVDGRSDLDWLLIFEDDVDQSEMNKFCEGLDKFVQSRLKEKDKSHWIGRTGNIDPLALNKRNFPSNPEEAKKQRFAMLGVFGFDLKKNHILVAGDDLLLDYQPPVPQAFATEMFAEYLSRAKSASPERFVLSVGTLMRVFMIKEGLVTLHKAEIRKFCADEKCPFDEELKACILRHYKLCYFEAKNESQKEENAKAFLSRIELLLARNV